MVTQKKRVQTFLDDLTFTALQEFAQSQELTLSSAVEKIITQHFKCEQPSDSPNEQAIEKMIEDSVCRHLDLFNLAITEVSDKLSRLELALAKAGIYSVDEQPSEINGEQLSAVAIESENYIICRLDQGQIFDFWGKTKGDEPCEKSQWTAKLDEATTYAKESIAKVQLSKLKKRFKGLDIRYNTISAVKLILENQD